MNLIYKKGDLKLMRKEKLQYCIIFLRRDPYSNDPDKKIYSRYESRRFDNLNPNEDEREKILKLIESDWRSSDWLLDELRKPNNESAYVFKLYDFDPLYE